MSETSVYLLPKKLLKEDKCQILPLKNPFTCSTSYFMLNESTREIFEIQGFNEKYRSWFLDGQVCSDSCMKIVTPFDPIFLILPYLIEATKNVPIDHLLQDEEFPHMVKLADMVEDLSCVADRKGPESLRVWTYNETSTLNWLSEKVDAVSEALLEARERPSMAYSLASDRDSYKCLSFSIISEFLCESLRTKLRTHLNLPQPDKENLPAGHDNAAKRPKMEETPDSKEEAKPAKKVVKQTAASKALAKSAQGSKSITSFFQKK